MRRWSPLALTLAALLASLPARALTPAEEARIELTTYAALYGAGVGLWSALELDLNARPAAWLTAGLAGGALWGTWEAAQTRDLQPNQTGLITSAAAWTMLDTLLLAAALDVDEDGAVWMALGAGAVAAGVAYGLAPYYETSVGDLSLINSGGLWTPVALTLLAAPALDEILDYPLAWVLLTSGLGLGAGALVAAQVQPTRTQALYLDAGLAVGTLGGGLVGLIGAVMSDSVEVGALITLAGMVTGGLVAVNLVGLDGAAGAAPVEPQAAPTRAEPTPMPLWVGVW